MQSEHKGIINSIKPALLSESEIQWLRGDKEVSKTFEYKMKSSIKRKVQSLTQLELPLLIKNNFFLMVGFDETNGLGRDLETGPQSLLNSDYDDLVRQRSRVQIPAKAPLFCLKRQDFRLIWFLKLRISTQILRIYTQTIVLVNSISNNKSLFDKQR
jgi:hypothetical protein